MAGLTFLVLPWTAALCELRGVTLGTAHRSLGRRRRWKMRWWRGCWDSEREGQRVEEEDEGWSSERRLRRRPWGEVRWRWRRGFREEQRLGWGYVGVRDGERGWVGVREGGGAGSCWVSAVSVGGGEASGQRWSLVGLRVAKWGRRWLEALTVDEVEADDGWVRAEEKGAGRWRLGAVGWLSSSGVGSGGAGVGFSWVS